MRSQKHLEPVEVHKHLLHAPQLGCLHLTLSERHRALSVSGTLKPSSRLVAVARKRRGSHAVRKGLSPDPNMETSDYIRSCLTPCKHRWERFSRVDSLFGKDTQPVGYDCRPRGFQPTERLREQGRYNVRSASGTEIPKFSSKHLQTFRNALIDGSSNDSYNDALLKALGEPPTPMKSKKH